jgi:hypothetical protein
MRTLAPALAALALATSCTLNTDYFKDYRGVNLIGNYDFNSLKADGVTPQWSLATSTDFMAWTPVPSDPERPTEAYRLEIKNLIPNGDFQDATKTPDATNATLPAGWSTNFFDGTVIASASINFGVTPSSTLHNGTIDGSRAMGWAALGAGNQLRLDLKGQVPTSAWQPIGYLFRADLMNVGSGPSIGMTLYDTATNGVNPETTNNQPNWTVTTAKADNSTDNTSVFSMVRPFLLTAAPGDLRWVAFGPNGTTADDAAIIDNVRLLPRYQSLVVSATLSTLESGVKPLLPGSKPGMYVFTIDVKNDPNAGAGNHFQPKAFTVWFDASVKSGTRNPSVTVAAPVGGWPTWTTLTFQLGFDFVNSDSDIGAGTNPHALSIGLSPTVSSTGDYDVGTVLVSRPTLSFNP